MSRIQAAQRGAEDRLQQAGPSCRRLPPGGGGVDLIWVWRGKPKVLFLLFSVFVFVLGVDMQILCVYI